MSCIIGEQNSDLDSICVTYTMMNRWCTQHRFIMRLDSLTKEHFTNLFMLAPTGFYKTTYKCLMSFGEIIRNVVLCGFFPNVWLWENCLWTGDLKVSILHISFHTCGFILVVRHTDMFGTIFTNWLNSEALWHNKSRVPSIQRFTRDCVNEVFSMNPMLNCFEGNSMLAQS